MALKIALSLFITAIHISTTEVIHCGRGSECRCSAFATGETCILDCNETQNSDMCKGKTLTCRKGDACHIKCESQASCSDDTIINAEASTDVTISCDGVDSCKARVNIKCGIGFCTLECTTETSCNDWGVINTSKSSGFTCTGYCPVSLPLYFSASPTNTPTISPTLPTTNPTISPTNYPSYIPTISPTHNPTQIPTNSPLEPTDSPTQKPTYFPTTYVPTSTPTTTISPTPAPTSLPVRVPTASKLGYKKGINLHAHEHYLQDPLFYMLAALLILIFCACCFLCVWMYSKEQKQKRLEIKIKSKSVDHDHSRNNSYTDTETHSLSMTNKYSKKKQKKFNKYSASSKPSMDTMNSSELYAKNEGPMPTYLKINTSDINAHFSFTQFESKCNPNLAKPVQRAAINGISGINGMRLNPLSDGNTTRALPNPPPRIISPRNSNFNNTNNNTIGNINTPFSPLSPYGFISNLSSPPQTPVPQSNINPHSPIIVIQTPPKNDAYFSSNSNSNSSSNEDIYEDNKTQYIKQNGCIIINANTNRNNIYSNNNTHIHYASLPTIPSLPAITPEHSRSNSLSINDALNTNAMLANHNNNHSIRISMVSQMVLDESKTGNTDELLHDDEGKIDDNEESESIEYQSHRKQTFESYDMENIGNNNNNKNNNNNNNNYKPIEMQNEFDINGIAKASTIKLDDIREDMSRNNSIVSEYDSETSVHTNGELSDKQHLTQKKQSVVDVMIDKVSTHSSTKL